MSPFAAAWQLAETVNGWLTRDEGELLFTLAQALPPGSTIVEIGSFFGRSTICLARGSMAGSGARVVAIDPQLGSPKHAHLLACDDPEPWFLGNLERAGVRALVTPLRLTSVAAARDVAGPIDLLFIDGSHAYADVADDWAHWFPKLRVGGVVAFHDSWHMHGVRRLSGELLRRGAPLAKPRLIDTITLATKTSTLQRHRAFVAQRAVRGWRGFLRLTYRGTRLRPVGK